MQRSAKCSTCSQPFGARESLRPNAHVTRIPLLLTCGHAFCEGCLVRRAKQEVTAICCPTCRIATPLKDGPAGVGRLPPDVYLLGQLLLQRSRHASNQVGLEFMKVSTEISTSSTKDKKTRKRDLCGECSIREASCRCTKCEVNMCTFCFDIVHKSSKILRKHQAIPLYEDESLAPNSAVCKLHDNRPIEYFCEDDASAICSHCVIVGDHQNHTITPMEVKNKAAIDDLETALKNTSVVQRTLHKSERVLAAVLPEVRQSMATVREEVQHQFFRLHGLLQARETQVLTEMGEIFEKEMEPLDRMRATLREEIARVESTLKDTEMAMNNQQHLVVNAQQVLSRLQSVQNAPCYVQLTRPETKPFSFEVDNSVVTTLETLGTLDTGSFLQLAVLPLTDVPPDALEEDQDSTSTDVTDSLSTSTYNSLSRTTSYGDHTSETNSEDMNGVLSTLIEASDSLKEKKLSGKRKAYRRRQVIKNNQVTVIVTHIKHPCSFMVQNVEDAESRARLMTRIQKYCAKPDTKNIPQGLQEGDAVLAQFSADGTWYRAQVRNVVLEDASPSVAKVEVTYVDFGNSEIVPLTRLKQMPPTFLKLPQLALHVSLIDIISSDKSGQWVLEAVHSFAEMTNEKPMLMHVLHVSTDGSPTLVDLCKPVGDDGADDRPVSVRDALVFLEYAHFVASSIYLGLPPRPQRRYVSPPPLNEREYVHCVVSHVNDPGHFYMQKLGDEVVHLLDLMQSLQLVYGHDNKDLWSVFYPQNDLVCVAQYEVDQQWYRAQVVATPGRCNVDIVYVDFGNTARVSHTKLKCIQPSFLVLPKQAVQCCLADVAPPVFNTWSTEAIARFNSFDLTQLTAVVKEVRERKAYLLLYTRDGLCINYQLVEEGHAISTGPGSKQPTVDIPTGQTSHAGKTETRKILKKSPSPGPVVQKPKCQVAEEHPKPDLMEAIVTHIEHPGHVYIQLTTAPHDGLTDLMAYLETTYCQVELEAQTWKVDDYCAVRSGKDGRWYRGKVVSATEDTYTVLFVDFGRKEELQASSMQPLQGEEERPAFALRCHLSGVQPAGDITRWSQTATEYLIDTVREKTVFIVPKGERDEDSFPVDLLVERKIEGDALNPETTEYPSVTDLLMERGVALPNRRLSRQKSGPQITVPPKPVENPKSNLIDSGSNASLGAVDSSNCDKTQTVIDTCEQKAISEQTVVVNGKDPPDKDALKLAGESHNSRRGQQVDVLEESIEASKSDENVEGGTVNKGAMTAPENLENRDEHVKAVTVAEKTTTKSQENGVVQGSDKLTPAAELDSQSSTSRCGVQGKGDPAPDFPPPLVPACTRFTAVPTYVDWQLHIYLQEVKDDEDMQGRFGYFLKEHTLETIIQDQYLASRSLHRARIPRDGNCLFRAFAQAIHNDQGFQGIVRQKAVDYLDKNWELLQGCLGGQEKEVYLSALRRDRQYGGEPEIEAICHSYNVSVELLIGGLNYPVQVHSYNEGDGLKVVRLVYVSDGNIDSGHYDLAVETDEAVSPVDSVYQTWRRTKMGEMRTWPMYQDNSLYDDSLLNQLMEHLHKNYANSGPDPAATWTVGQPVIALFSADQCFYRAKVIAITAKGIKVQYIDFGNCEIVAAEWVRADIMLTEIPQQCLTCTLHGVRSKTQDGRWPKAVLDYVHKLIVNEQCTIEIVERHDAAKHQEVHVCLADGRDLGTLLVDAGVALVGVQGETTGPETLYFNPSSEGSSDNGSEGAERIASPVSEERRCAGEENTAEMDIPERSVPSPYHAMVIPKVGDTIVVGVTQVNTPNEVYIQHVKVDTGDVDHPAQDEAQRDLTAMLLLDSSMNAQAEFYEPLACIKTGAPCCAQFSLDGRWYRGETLSVERRGNTTEAGLLFVDYGSFEWISDRDRLRTLPEEFLSLPMQALRCIIGGLTPPAGAERWSAVARDEATRIYLGQAPLIALIQSVEPCVELQLYSYSEFTETHQLGHPVYRALVDNGHAALNSHVTQDGTVVEAEEDVKGYSNSHKDIRQDLTHLDDEVD